MGLTCLTDILFKVVLADMQLSAFNTGMQFSQFNTDTV